MADAADERPSEPPPFAGIPGVADLFEASDEMLAFLDTYQRVWEQESRAMHALGDFLGARAESLRLQAELMRGGSEAFRRYARWSERLLGLRPESMMQAWLRFFERPRPGPGDEPK
jgi:hypothetical protein